MKKGFTVVELIITFSLTVVIATFLLQLILSLNNLYQNSGIKTELLNRQFIISNKINKTLNEKELISLTSCGNNCLNFNYKDSTKDIFKIDYSNNILQFGNFSTTLPNDTYFKNVNIDILYSTMIDYNSNNAILNINIPIHNDKLSNEDFNVNVVYQFNINNTNISYVNFSGSDNYIVLKGDTEQTISSKTSYVEEGYTVYDKNGNTISGNVEIENPLTTLPYKSGRYIIKYNLKDNDGNIISQATRSVEVEPSVYEITNLVVNGSFENELDGWKSTGTYNDGISISSDLSISGSKSVKFDSTNATEYHLLMDSIMTIHIPIGHKFYVSSYVNVTKYDTGDVIPCEMYNQTMNDIHFRIAKLRIETDSWIKQSTIGENNLTTDLGYYRLGLWAEANLGDNVAYFDDLILVDLTETFGAGNEPSKEWCDENIDWFEGTTKISY